VAGHNGRVPTYEYRCKDCTTTFEVRRPMSESSAPAPCPDGHDNTVKLLSMVSLGSGGDGASMGGGGGGGGCCGGGCGCG
jgi:putative FmdB family regulatory protein